MIPLSIPNISGNEWQYVKECLDTGWVSSVGSYVNKFEDIIKNYTGAKYTIATSNGTSALHIALQLAGVKPVNGSFVQILLLWLRLIQSAIAGQSRY